MRRLRHLSGRHRTPSTNRLLGLLLAFNAGAINAGGFLVVGLYTSHMTGFVSVVADNLVLGQLTLVLGALGALLFFLAGAATTAVLVNWARQRQLSSGFALPLLLEAGLLLTFGLVGATLDRQTPFAVPVTVLLLAFTMGLQNALVTKISSAQIRTTHMTGVITDLGIELGRLVYWNRSTRPANERVVADRDRLKVLVWLCTCFLVGGVSGALGFKHVGYATTLPLAALLVVMSIVPVLDDLMDSRRRGA